MSLKTIAAGLFHFFVPKGGFTKNLQAGIECGKQIDKNAARRVANSNFYKAQKEKQENLKRRIYK